MTMWNRSPIQVDGYDMAIAELSLSGAISLGKCSVSTLYRWRNKINERLERERADWRVEAEKDGRVIKVKL